MGPLIGLVVGMVVCTAILLTAMYMKYQDQVTEMDEDIAFQLAWHEAIAPEEHQ